MPILVLLLVAGVLVVLLISKLFAPSLDPAINAVLKGGEVGPLLERLQQLRPGAQPDAFNRAIRRLWDEYQRERAVPLIRALAVAHSKERISQYWLGQVQTVEPELARASFDEAFLAEHYQPEVAHACGPVG
jgi:hypothetical protein